MWKWIACLYVEHRGRASTSLIAVIKDVKFYHFLPLFSVFGCPCVVTVSGAAQTCCRYHSAEESSRKGGTRVKDFKSVLFGYLL